MHETEEAIAELGNEPPLLADGRSGPPDRREVSARWLSGTFLTGVTSSILMGVALLAALDGREQLATPPEIMKLTAAADDGESGEDAKTDAAFAAAPDRQGQGPAAHGGAHGRRRVGDHDVVHNMPFVQIKMALAAGHKTTRKYPAFDPFAVASADGEPPQIATDISSAPTARAESDMSIKTVDFPIETAAFDEKSGLSADEVEDVVRSTAAVLTDGAVQVAALHYVDPQRFGDLRCRAGGRRAYGVRIVQENVSVAPRAPVDQDSAAYAEDIIPFTEDRNIKDALAQAGYEGDDAVGMAEAISKLLNTEALKQGTVLRVGLMVHGDEPKVVRTSVYDRTDAHIDDRARRPRASSSRPTSRSPIRSC